MVAVLSVAVASRLWHAGILYKRFKAKAPKQAAVAVIVVCGGGRVSGT